MLTSMVCPWFALICSLFVSGSSLRANLFLSFSSTTFLISFSEYLLNCRNFNSSSTKTNPVGINIKLILTNIFYNRWVNHSFPDQKIIIIHFSQESQYILKQMGDGRKGKLLFTYNELLDLQHQILRYKMCATDGETIWYFESWEWKC